jgi:hypothetical protein
MDEEHLSPFPTALVLDTSFLRTIGGTGSEPYGTFVRFVKEEGIHLYLTPRVVAELGEQRGYIGVDWVDRADTTEWLTLIDTVQLGVRVHDGPRAGEIMDRVHERLARFEQVNPDELRKTDSELPAAAVMLLGSTRHDAIGILMDDRNAEQSISGVVDNTYYEGRIRVLGLWEGIEYIEARMD